jgi:hypothetical protein
MRTLELSSVRILLWGTTICTGIAFPRWTFYPIKSFVAGINKLRFGNCVRWSRETFCPQLSIIPTPHAQMCSRAEGNYQQAIGTRHQNKPTGASHDCAWCRHSRTAPTRQAARTARWFEVFTAIMYAYNPSQDAKGTFPQWGNKRGRFVR